MKTEVETTTKWTIDKAHSSIEFKARHLMITTVTGVFKEYEADIETEGDKVETAQITFAAFTNSVYTGDEKRDGHLRSADFFDVEKYPRMIFASTRIEKKSDNKFLLHGNLTIRDVTKPITVDVTYEGM